jgi:acetoin utilization deacetylase AcuC-like enzyme
MRLAAGDGSDAFRRHWRTSALPALRAFRPQLVVVSAGFDALRGDPLANIQLEAADYRWLTHELRDIAEASAQGRIVSTLEGGYGLTAIGPAVVAHLMALGDARAEPVHCATKRTRKRASKWILNGGTGWSPGWR